MMMLLTVFWDRLSLYPQVFLNVLTPVSSPWLLELEPWGLVGLFVCDFFVWDRLLLPSSGCCGICCSSLILPSVEITGMCHQQPDQLFFNYIYLSGGWRWATAYVCRSEDNLQGISSTVWVLGRKLSQAWRHFCFNHKKKAFFLYPIIIWLWN